MENKIIQCPKCSKKMQIPPAFFGKKIKCPQCSSVLVIDAQGGVTLGAPVAPPPASPQKAPAPKQPVPQKAPAPLQSTPVKPAPKQPAPPQPETKAPAQAQTPIQAPAPAAAAKPKKTKPDLRPKSAVTKPKAIMKKGMKVAGKATKGKLQVQKVKAKKRVSGIKLQKTNKKISKDKLSAASRFERKKASNPLTKLGLVLGFVAVIAAVAYFIFSEGPGTQSDPTPTQVLLQSVKFIDQGEKDIMDYNTITGKIHTWNRVINTELPIPNLKPEDGERTLKISDTTEFVHIPAGVYKIGFNSDSVKQDQSPEIEVKVNDYYISQKEISIKQFRYFMKYIDMLKRWQDSLVDEAKKFYFQGAKYAKNRLIKAAALDPTIFDHPDQPNDIIHRVDPNWDGDPAAHQISWWSAYAYCAWANQLDPNKGNLPTEVEWEIAARGKQGHLYPWGNNADDLKTPADAEDKEILSQYGFYPGNTKPYDPNEKIEPGDPKYHEPKMNSFGLYDMAGNVSEWCFDPYVTKLYHFLKDINANKAEGEETPDFTIFYKGGASEEDIMKYGIEPDQKAARINAGNLTLEQKGLLRFTTRNGVSTSNTSFAIGFRCVYYKDSPAPNAELLKELYDRRKKIREYEWAKRIAQTMIELAEDANDKEALAEAKKDLAKFEEDYKDMIAQDTSYGKAETEKENTESSEAKPEDSANNEKQPNPGE